MSKGARNGTRARPGTVVKAAKFAEGVAAGKSQRQAALDAGFPPSIAKMPKNRIVPYVPGSLKAAIQAAIKPRDIAKVLADGLRAEDVRVGFADGAAIREVAGPDHKERRQHAELAAKLGGMIEREADDTSEVKVTVQVLG